MLASTAREKLSYSDWANYLAWGMIGNGLFVAPILTFILPAYYGYRDQNLNFSGFKLLESVKKSIRNGVGVPYQCQALVDCSRSVIHLFYAKIGFVEFLTECPAFFIPLYFLINSSNLSMRNVVVLLLMITHYFQRSFVYALLIRSSKPVPISITFFAFVFCTYNGAMQVKS